MRDMTMSSARGCPNATVGGTGEGGEHPGGIPDVSRFRTDGPEGEVASSIG